MMRIFRHMSRFLSVLMICVFAGVGVVAPAQAAEEDIHHATQHGQADETASTTGEPADEGSVHPEHAAGCHSGASHFHAMARGATGPVSIQAAAIRLTAPQLNQIPQTGISRLLRPPRI